jgi:hypothetical protein
MNTPVLTLEEKRACLEGPVPASCQPADLLQAQRSLAAMSAKSRALIAWSDRVGAETMRLVHEVHTLRLRMQAREAELLRDTFGESSSGVKLFKRFGGLS